MSASSLAFATVPPFLVLGYLVFFYCTVYLIVFISCFQFLMIFRVLEF